VKVFKMEVPGSPLFAFKGEIVAPIHIGKIMSTFTDASQRKEWVDRYYAQESLFKDRPLAERYWIRFDLPFPILDRDYVMEFEAVPNAATRTILSTVKSTVDPKKPEQECCVRAVVEGTFYKFEAVPGKEETRMTVEVRTNPKGLLPGWLVNLIQKKWPSKTLSGLIRASEKNNKIHPDFADWHQAAKK